MAIQERNGAIGLQPAPGLSPDRPPKPELRISIADYEATDKSGRRLLRWTDHISIVRMHDGRYVIARDAQAALMRAVEERYGPDAVSGGKTRLCPVRLYARRPLDHLRISMQYRTRAGLHCQGSGYRLITEAEAIRLREKGTEIAWPPPDGPLPILYYVGSRTEFVREGTRVVGTKRGHCFPATCSHFQKRECKPYTTLFVRLPFVEGAMADAMFVTTGWRTRDALYHGLARCEMLISRACTFFPMFFRLPEAMREAIRAQVAARLPLRLRLYTTGASFAAQNGAIGQTSVPVVTLEFDVPEEEAENIAREEIERYLKLVAALAGPTQEALQAVGQPQALPEGPPREHEPALTAEFWRPDEGTGEEEGAQEELVIEEAAEEEALAPDEPQDEQRPDAGDEAGDDAGESGSAIPEVISRPQRGRDREPMSGNVSRPKVDPNGQQALL